MMLLERIAILLRMDDEVWARHANPWSVWTRIPLLALMVLVAWSRVWIGWWALLPLALTILWAWLNPRLFPPPRFTDNWASKATFGERVWLNRKLVPIPARHRWMPHLLVVISVLGACLLIWGMVALRPWPTLLGLMLAYGGKIWFVDRMVWLYEDMKDLDSDYRGWLRERSAAKER
jgi:hypothetical protein